jgi:hypothetical protein
LTQTGQWLSSALGKGRLGALVSQIFFPVFENIFEAEFSRAKGCDVFTSRSPLGGSQTQTLALEHLGSKLFSDPGEKAE